MPAVAHGELDPPGREEGPFLLVAVSAFDEGPQVEAGDERPRRVGEPLQNGKPALLAAHSSSFDDSGVDGNDAPHEGQRREGRFLFCFCFFSFFLCCFSFCFCFCCCFCRCLCCCFSAVVVLGSLCSSYPFPFPFPFLRLLPFLPLLPRREHRPHQLVHAPGGCSRLELLRPSSVHQQAEPAAAELDL